MKNPLSRHVILLAAIALASPTAWAQTPAASANEGYCDPQVAQAMVAEYKAKQADRDATFNPLLKSIKDVAAESAMDLSSCVDGSWPTASFSFPTMDQVIRGVAKAAVNKACGVQRDAMSKVNSVWTNSFYMNTRIPGVPNFGVSTYGSQDGGVTVNGQPPRP